MRYDDFIEHLNIHSTSDGKGKGVRCNLALYAYPDGHGHIYCVEDDGRWTSAQKKLVTTPTSNPLETIDSIIDVLYAMHKKAKRVGRARRR